MIIRYWMLVPLFTLVLSACQILPGESQAHFEPQPVHYSCGLLEVEFEVDGSGATLDSGDRTIAMTPVGSVSGNRYQSDDTQTEFWQRGSVARLVLEGQTWPECTQWGAVPPYLEARGNEPFWHLKLDSNRAVLNRLGFDQEEEGPVIERSNDGSIGRASLHFGSVQEQLTVEYSQCRDTMTGMPYPYSVQLTREAERLQGCAGKPYDMLQGPQWRVTTLQGRAVPDDIDLTLHFSEERRLSGRAACNRYFGAVRLSGEGLDFGSLGSTRMNCSGEVMEWERIFLSTLAQVSRFNIKDDRELILFVGDTPSLVADF